MPYLRRGVNIIRVQSFLWFKQGKMQTGNNYCIRTVLRQRLFCLNDVRGVWTPYTKGLTFFVKCLHHRCLTGSSVDLWNLADVLHTAQKTKFSIMDFFSKCDQIRSMENFIFLCNGTLYELPPSREIQTLLGFASLYFKVQKSVLRIERECRRKGRLLQ